MRLSRRLPYRGGEADAVGADSERSQSDAEGAPSGGVRAGEVQQIIESAAGLVCGLDLRCAGDEGGEGFVRVKAASYQMTTKPLLTTKGSIGSRRSKSIS